MRKQHTFPTIVGLILLILVVGAGVFFVQTRQTFTLSASADETPKNVRITNVTDVSFSVSWTTDKPTFGYVTYEKSDELAHGSLGNQTKSSIHYLTVKDLRANTNYQFKIGSGENLFDNDGQAYKIKTGQALILKKKSDMVFGVVVGKNGQPIDGALVYLALPGASPMSTFIDSDGSWAFNLSMSRQANLKEKASYTKDTILEVYVRGDAGVAKNQVATAKIPVGAARPVPKMVLGENYNFSNIITIKSGDDLPSSNIDFGKRARENEH